MKITKIEVAIFAPNRMEIATKFDSMYHKRYRIGSERLAYSGRDAAVAEIEENANITLIEDDCWHDCYGDEFIAGALVESRMRKDLSEIVETNTDNLILSVKVAI